MALTPTQKLNVRKAMSDFCLRAEKQQLAWHYSRQRPFGGFNVQPEQRHVNDCSGYIALVYAWAMHNTSTYMADPLGYRYSGYGYTGSEITWLQKHGKKLSGPNYQVGDIAINGHSASSTDHTFICRKAGTATTSVWSSNGNEHSPNRVTLNYHPVPLVGVWRHPSLL